MHDVFQTLFKDFIALTLLVARAHRRVIGRETPYLWGSEGLDEHLFCSDSEAGVLIRPQVGCVADTPGRTAKRSVGPGRRPYPRRDGVVGAAGGAPICSGGDGQRSPIRSRLRPIV